MTDLFMRLDLFDGGAAGGGAGAAGGAEGGNSGAAPAGETGEVLYGKQAEPQVAAEETKPSPEDKRKAFMDMVKGEYKDIYTQETQKIIDRRFKETKNLEETIKKASPTINMLMQRYGIADGDYAKLQEAVENDDAYWSQAADEAGMTTDQYKKFQKLQRQNAELIKAQNEQKARENADAQVQKWLQEQEEVRAEYPEFDLSMEISQNKQFVDLISAGIPVKHAYEVTHLDSIKSGIRATTEAQTARKVTDDIRARGMRPKENGTASQAAFTVKDDVSKLTRKDRADIARRVAMGELISF